MLAIVIFGGMDRNYLFKKLTNLIKLNSMWLFNAILNNLSNIFLYISIQKYKKYIDGFNFGSAKPTAKLPALTPCQLSQVYASNVE